MIREKVQSPKALDNREYEYNNIMVNTIRVFASAFELNLFKEPLNIYTQIVKSDSTNVLNGDTNTLLHLIGENMKKVYFF